MDVFAIVLLIIIAICFIALFFMRRRNRLAKKSGQITYKRSNDNDNSVYELINRIKAEEQRERNSDRLPSLDIADENGGRETKKVNVGRIFGFDKDILWDQEEYDQFEIECQKNGYLPQEIFEKKRKLAENAAKITMLLDEMIDIENAYNTSKSDNVAHLELLRKILCNMYD